MKKLITYSAILITGLCMFFAACQGPMNYIQPGEQDQQQNQKGLLITIDGLAAQRTLFPAAPNFDTYVLRFIALEGQTAHADLTLKGKTSQLVSDLEDGRWGIYAVGEVESLDLAEGAGWVTVDSGSFQGLVIKLQGITDGANGVFSWSVSFPEELVDNAHMQIWSANGLWNDGWDLSDSYLSDDISLAPGYYFVQTDIYPLNGKQLAKLEAVHICSNLATHGDFVFTESDFQKYISISGAIDVTTDGYEPDQMFVEVYLDEVYRAWIGGVLVYGGKGEWEVRIPALAT